ncbi:MAG TPA: iron ABC transporter permease [Actinomycetota bacterium]|nr:iron ABC transporter permease [Actinomycetota bacterium]
MNLKGPDQPGPRSVSVVPTKLRARAVGLALLVLSSAVLAGVAVGPVKLHFTSVLAELIDRLPLFGANSGLAPQQEAILLQIRLPRVLLAGLVGAALAVSGAAFQGVFRNPLADPYLLGAAAGAGLGATLAIAYGWSSYETLTAFGIIPVAAFAGAVTGVAAAYALGRSAGGRSPVTLILSGVAVAAFLTALQIYFQQRNSETLREVYAWILGGFGTSGWRSVWMILPYVFVSVMVITLHRRLLDVMSLGEDESGGLGVRASRVRLTVVVAASLGTAAAVAVSGLIGFVGIIVPHTVRLIAGSSYRILVPLSVVYGAAFLILTDLLARTVVAPAELPLGVVTAFFGAPFFALILRTSRKAL